MDAPPPGMTTAQKYILLASVVSIALIASVFMSDPKQGAKKPQGRPAAAKKGPPPNNDKPLVEASPSVTGLTVKSSGSDKVVPTKFPHMQRGNRGEKLDFNFLIDYKAGESTMVRIIPDDCIEVFEINGKPVALAGEAKARRCNWQVGFKLDLKPYLQPGPNTVRLNILNNGGPMGLKFRRIQP